MITTRASAMWCLLLCVGLAGPAWGQTLGGGRSGLFGGGGGTGSLTVNGSGAATNLSNSSPAAPAGATNCTWQISGANTSCNFAIGLAPRAVTGTTSTDTLVAADDGGKVDYETSVSVATAICTTAAPTCGITAPNPRFSLDNQTTGSNTTVTLTPQGSWTINSGSSLIIYQNNTCDLYADGNVARNWLARCYPTRFSPAVFAPNSILESYTGDLTVNAPSTLVLQAGGANVETLSTGTIATVAIGNAFNFAGLNVNALVQTPGNPDVITTVLKATAALTSGQLVKVDTANANSVVVATTTDTGAGAVIGFVENSPGIGGAANIATPGSIITDPLLGTGTCAIGNFVIVDTTTNGRIKCTSTYAAGTVQGYAVTAQSVVGSAVSVYVLPR